MTDARQQHELLTTLPGYDARAQYAFALVLIKQCATDEAIGVLGQVLVRQPDSLPAWRAKVWAEMAARKYREAIDDMRAAAAVIEKQGPDSLSADTIEEQHATAYFFGRAFSFVERARANALSAGDLRRSKQNVMSKLGARRADFVEGEEAVAEDFSDAAAELKKVEAADAAAGEQKQQELKQQLKAIDTAGAKVEYESEKFKTQLQRQLEELDSEGQTAQKNILKAQFNLNTLDQAIGIAQQQITIQNIAAQRQPAAAGRLIATQNNLQRLIAQRLLVTQQLAESNFQWNAIVLRRTALLGDGEQTAEQLQARSSHLRREEKKLQYAEKMRPKGSQVSSSQSRALRDQKQAFRTYEPFPFEREKQRVLTWLQNG